MGTVTCPTCFENFSIPLPGRNEVPCDLDYDCEVCCRPMMISCWFDEVEEEVVADARGLEE